jgi:proteasome accessory factor B
VIGFDTAHEEVRTYRADRIAGDVQVGAAGAFTRPADFDPLAAFPADPKELGDVDAVATVLVDASRARFMEAEVGQAAVRRRRDDGSIEVDVACANLDAFRSWLLGWGEHAEVLGPAEVRAAMIEWLRLVAGRR